MRYTYNYVYYHIYQLTSKWRKYNARESAILYLSVILCLITMPFVFGIISKLFGSIPKGWFFIIGGIHCLLIYWLNKKYFERKNYLKKILDQFKNESDFQRKLGLLISLLLLIMSPVLFFLLLTLNRG